MVTLSGDDLRLGVRVDIFRRFKLLDAPIRHHPVISSDGKLGSA
jgi:hypothetical protein